MRLHLVACLTAAAACSPASDPLTADFAALQDCRNGDLNKDGAVDAADYNIWIEAHNAGAPYASPSHADMLAMMEDCYTRLSGDEQERRRAALRACSGSRRAACEKELEYCGCIRTLAEEGPNRNSYSVLVDMPSSSCGLKDGSVAGNGLRTYEAEVFGDCRAYDDLRRPLPALPR